MTSSRGVKKPPVLTGGCVTCGGMTMPRKAARDTKKLILQVALKQFSEKGFDGVGIRDIAKEDRKSVV